MNNDFQFHVRADDSLEIDHSFAGDSFFKAGVKRFLAKKSNVFGLALLCLLMIMSLIGPYLSGHPRAPLRRGKALRYGGADPGKPL